MNVQTQSITMNATCALSTYTQRTRELNYTLASGKYKDMTPTRLLPIVSWFSCPKPDMTRSWVDDAARLSMTRSPFPLYRT